jgi:hypothetical protein
VLTPCVARRSPRRSFLQVMVEKMVERSPEVAQLPSKLAKVETAARVQVRP